MTCAASNTSWGFPVSPRIDDEHVPEGVADAVFAWLREVDERFSPFKAGSEVSRLDRGELRTDEVSADLAEVLDLRERYRVATGGVCRARLPGITVVAPSLTEADATATAASARGRGGRRVGHGAGRP